MTLIQTIEATRKGKPTVRLCELPVPRVQICILISLFSLLIHTVLGQSQVIDQYGTMRSLPGDPHDQYPKMQIEHPITPSQRSEQQLQINTQKMMGYTPPPTQEQITEDLKNQRRGQFEKPVGELELNQLEKIEAENANDPEFRIANIQSGDANVSLKIFQEALQRLRNMADGKEPYNIKQAVFIVENAYYNNSLSYKSFDLKIKHLVSVCRMLLRRNGYSEKNADACQWAIQRLFSDTIKIGKNKWLYPFSYDFVDFYGNKDWSKMFVTKLLRTHTGQCHSMPLLYLILAEELHCQAYLTLAPQHSFIQYQDKAGDWYNYETTVGRLTNSTFALASGEIHVEAIQNKIYLSPLSRIETMARCIGDLASGYQKKYGISDFVVSCANIAAKYYPNDLFPLGLQDNIYRLDVKRIAKTYGNPNPANLKKYPKLQEALDRMFAWKKKIADLGYNDSMTEAEYKKWLLSAKKKFANDSKDLSTKAKRNISKGND